MAQFLALAPRSHIGNRRDPVQQTLANDQAYELRVREGPTTVSI